MLASLVTVWVCVKDLRNSNEVLLGCIYRSGTSTTAKKYDKWLHEQLMWHPQYAAKRLRLLLDFNYPNISWSPEPSISTSTSTESNSRTPSSEYVFIECLRDIYLFFTKT